jgi:predicted transcriptional regulator
MYSKEMENYTWRLGHKVDALTSKLTALEGIVKVLRDTLPHIKETDLNTIFTTLPGHQQKTVLAIRKLKTSVTAEDISKITKRARAVESSYLNTLAVEGIVSKERRGRKTYFTLLTK